MTIINSTGCQLFCGIHVITACPTPFSFHFEEESSTVSFHQENGSVQINCHSGQRTIKTFGSLIAKQISDRDLDDRKIIVISKKDGYQL